MIITAKSAERPILYYPLNTFGEFYPFYFLNFEYSVYCIVQIVLRNRGLREITFFGFDVLLFVDQRVLRRFRAERQRDEHEYARHENDGQQYGPVLFRAQNVVQSQNLRNQNRDRDHQLINGSNLWIVRTV